MPNPARSFADDIRARSAHDIGVLLRARPDCARPAPSDLTALAARAQTRASVQRALEGLNARELRLLEALLVVGPTAAPDALGASKKAVSEGISTLWGKGLLWHSPSGYVPVRAVADVLTSPAGLGPLLSETIGATSAVQKLAQALSQAEDPQVVIAEVLAPLSDRARAVIDQLRWTNPLATFASPALRTVRQELIASGLMVAQGSDNAVIPREIGVALRGGRLFNTDWEHADVDPAVASVERIDEAGAAVIGDLLWRLDDIATFLDETEPRVLRTEGLSVRDHRKLAVELDATTELTAFLLELGYAARLWSSDGEIDPAWRPTQWYDEWTQLDAAQRWSLVALAWRDTSRAASLAGQTIDGTLINVLGRDANWPLLRSRRRDVLEVLRELPAGTTPSSDEVDALLRWHRPLRLPDGAPTRADLVLAEAGWLGVTGLGGLTSAGRALLGVDVRSDSGPEDHLDAITAVVAALLPALPATAPGVLLQADLTAVAPGTLAPPAATFMRGAADIESRGGATVFRFSSGSVRRYLDAGHSADDMLAQLRAIAMTPVPQPLEYLIHDVARRHGQLRVGSVGSYVRSSDDAALDTLLADASVAHLQLRRLGPQVLVSPLPAATTLDALRAGGQSPVAETSDGGVVVRVGHAPRAATPRQRHAPLAISRLDEAQAMQLATQLHEHETVTAPTSAALPRIPSSDPTVTLTMLDEAAAEQVPVWIGYVDATGDVKRTLFRPERIAGGRVSGTVGDAAKRPGQPARTQSFSIHRITGVAPA